jgi:hypothetical protein
MTAPRILFLASLLGCALALFVPGWSDLLLVAVPSAVASLWLIIWSPRKKAPRKQLDGHVAAPLQPIQWLVIDGSNVLHWKDDKPNLETLRQVVGHLTQKGYTPGVMFDANAGYLISNRYQHDKAFGRLLGLPEDRIMVVPKGSPADPAILQAARDLGARIVSNDRYRDWVGQFPEVQTPGHLIRGGYRNDELWLDLPPAAASEWAVPKGPYDEPHL